MKNILSILGAIALTAVIMYFYAVRPAIKDKENFVSLLDSTRTEFTTYRDEMGREVTTQKQTITTLENALQAQIIEKEELEKHNLKQIETIVRLETDIQFLKMEINFDDPDIITKPATDTTDWEQYLRVPQQFAFEDTWTDIFGEVTSGGILIDSLTIRTGTNIFVGYQSGGFLRKADPVVIVEYKNPYMQTVKMDNIQIINKPPFYRRPWWHRAEGAALFLIINLLK